MKYLLAFLLLVTTDKLTAQEKMINPKLLKGSWPSSWISCPGANQREYGVFHFRKKISLGSKPSSFIIHVTADNRYRLFVNGKAVCYGPARGDLYNWYFETIDLAPFLSAGENTIAALVWNMGTDAPVAQVSNQTGFVMQGNSDAEKAVNTNNSWKVLQDISYKAVSKDNGSRLRTYMVIGPGDEVEGNNYPWGWESAAFDDAQWKPAVSIAQPVIAGYGTDNLWTLAPRNIPLMEEKLQRIPTVRRSSGIEPGNGFLSGNATLSIPANKTVTILLDQTFNTIAYPELLVSQGKGSQIKLTYAEALFKDRIKGDRNDIEGKEIMGNFDIFKPDGGSKRLFRPLWVRTYRYLQMDITTGEQPLEINDFYGMYTGYPFKPQASFSCNDRSMDDIWNVGWRTARMCAGETYYDCPYYEQLQYEGDTRIQSLISLYVTGDDRLMRKALIDFYHSRVPEGLTQGRYPSNRLQVIPPFSLFWVSMIHDYWMHRQDEGFVKQFLIGVQGVLDWYEKNIDQEKHMLGPMKWWNFTDWNNAFPNGTPDGATDGNSSVITLQYVYTLRQAAQLFDYFNNKTDAAHYRDLANKLAAGTYAACFDQSRMEMANTPAKNTFSQHASIMGVLSQSVPASQAKAVMQKVLYDSSLSQATFYYRFYLNIALRQSGLGNLYYSQLKPWRDMLKVGLTTFAENPDPTRSDCHAWSASPNYDFFATICGIMPAAPGFKKINIAPALGELTEVNAKMPHPNGEISLILKRDGKDKINAEIVLPQQLTGSFIWNGKTVPLKGGKQVIKM